MAKLSASMSELVAVFLGLWFLYQLVEADFGLFDAQADGGGVAFFAHVGGFVFGVAVARLTDRRVRRGPQRSRARVAGPPGPGWMPSDRLLAARL
jgi:membrane associated rhomboid family serine protease